MSILDPARATALAASLGVLETEPSQARMKGVWPDPTFPKNSRVIRHGCVDLRNLGSLPLTAMQSISRLSGSWNKGGFNSCTLWSKTGCCFEGSGNFTSSGVGEPDATHIGCVDEDWDLQAEYAQLKAVVSEDEEGVSL
jgi:hypothetical protein